MSFRSQGVHKTACGEAEQEGVGQPAKLLSEGSIATHVCTFERLLENRDGVVLS